MNEQPDDDVRTLPSEALDEDGRLLPPEKIPLSALVDPAELSRFAESIADLTQLEAAALLYDPESAVPVSPGAEIQIIRSPVCAALHALEEEGKQACLRDVHAAAHKALERNACVTADCAGGEGLLFACPVVLSRDGNTYPKACIVAAAHDTYCFHFADRLAKLTSRSVREMEDLLCETDKRALNAAQLRRLRSIMEGQVASFSRGISDRYAELASLAVVLSQREELVDAYARLDREVQIVGQIQRVLVPSGPPTIEGFQVACHYATARQAGGDYYDFEQLHDGSWGFLVADASGHGVPAAVVMAMIHAIVHAYPEEVETAGQVMNRLNGYLVNCGIEGSFATCFVGILHPESGRLRCANAGHDPALLFTRATGDVTEVGEASALPLGILEENPAQEMDLALASGDVLLVYTDGITEMHSPKQGIFTRERLIDSLRRHGPGGAEVVRRGVIAEVMAFGEGLPVGDDQTLVVLERL